MVGMFNKQIIAFMDHKSFHASISSRDKCIFLSYEIMNKEVSMVNFPLMFILVNEKINQ